MDQLQRRAKTIDDLVRRFQSEKTANPPAWILPPASCQFVTALCGLFQDCRAFEFGSGRSTHALRSASQFTTTVESSDEWLARTEEDQPSKREADRTFVIPLRRLWNRARLIESFDVSSERAALEALRQSNVVLVDSPPNPAKREHALFTALRFAPVGAVIVLDDLEVRAVGRFAHRLATQNKNTFRFWLLDMDHQLGVFLKVHDVRVRSRPTLREFIGTWLRV